jgi:hypothetical protein
MVGGYITLAEGRDRTEMDAEGASCRVNIYIEQDGFFPRIEMSSPRRWAMAILLATMLMSLSHVQAVTVNLDDELIMDYDPQRLTLKPRERGTFTLEFTNLGESTTFVGIDVLAIKSPGGSQVAVVPDFFELGPGGRRTVEVIVQSHAEWGVDADISDAHLVIFWGPTVTPDQDAWDTTGSTYDIDLPVEDDFSRTEAMLILGAVAVVIFIAIPVWLVIRRRRAAPQAPSGQGEDDGRA